MVSEPIRKSGRFTYSEYLTWPVDERWELIGGQAWAMSPSPGEFHQRIQINFASSFHRFLRDKSCRVYAAPFDVVLSEQDVVQPDILVVCDKSKITATHVAGAPDLVVEILSPATSAKDRREKFDLYERYGVREYLIVHPEEQYIEQFILNPDGHFGRPVIVPATESYKSFALDGLEVGLREVFE